MVYRKRLNSENISFVICEMNLICYQRRADHSENRWSGQQKPDWMLGDGLSFSKRLIEARKQMLSGVRSVASTQPNALQLHSLRPMRIIIEHDPESASNRAAEIISSLVQQRPSCVLGLATGSTPLGIYQKLIARHQNHKLDFANVTTFNLDEYVGLGPGDPQSYRFFMQENLFNHINIPPENTHVPDVRALDFDSYSIQYEKSIQEAGGIDLQVLGVGGDGHIAFNEPGSSLGSRTRLKTLTSETVKDNARFFDDIENVPRLAVTVGVGTILESRKCLLVAFGEHKARAISQAVEGPVTAQVTASALQLHPDVTVILDQAAACHLQRKAYYAEVEESHRLLEK